MSVRLSKQIVVKSCLRGLLFSLIRPVVGVPFLGQSCPRRARIWSASGWLRWSFVCAFVLLLSPAANALGRERYFEFVDGLRDRQYYDEALFYLDLIRERASVPAEVKRGIPYYKAMILKDTSRKSRTPEKQTELLLQSLALFEQFATGNPNQREVADAYWQRALIHFSQARIAIVQSRSPANQGTRRDLQAAARKQLIEARALFRTVFDQHEAALKTYPQFIDQQKEPDQFLARVSSEENLVNAMLNLALCRYYEAQTYDTGTPTFQQLLYDAASEFQTMSQRYRSQVGGLYARAWQGKCYDECHDRQQAMGIYTELLDHPGENPELEKLKTQTLYFKMICLNGKEQNNSQQVIELAEEWLKKNPSNRRTETGLGIQWEQARALELVGDAFGKKSKSEAERVWRQARSMATQINKYPSEFKEDSQSMLERLQVKLGGKSPVPRDFDSAFISAGQSFRAALELQKEIDGAARPLQSTQATETRDKDWRNALEEAAQNLDNVLSLATKRSDPKRTTEARLWSAYVNYWQGKNYESAVLAQFVARTADRSNGTVGLDAAFMGFAAFVKAFHDNKLPFEEKAEDIRLVIQACSLITDRWPSSDRGYEAQMTLGEIFSRAKQPLQAAEWYGKIPESDSRFGHAQIAAGQAYLNVYEDSLDVGTGAAQELNDWLERAARYLRTGLTQQEALLPKEGPATPEMISAKLSLAQILIRQSRDAEALTVLTEDPHSITKAVSVEQESERPDYGITGRPFAIETYKLLLRACVGTRNLQQARETMSRLEAISEAGSSQTVADVTDLYVGLGRLLKEELERFRNNGEVDRFQKLLVSFETFLNDLSERTEGQTFMTLSWIGETYCALGESVANNVDKSASFYRMAGMAFRQIVTQSTLRTDFVSPDQLLRIKLRQVRVYQSMKEFEAAESLMGEILKARPNDIKVQCVASELYRDWGTSRGADGSTQLLAAIRGEDRVGAWGWGQISLRVQRSKAFGIDPAYLETFLDARFKGTQTRRIYAGRLPPLEKQKELERCLTEIIATATVTKDMAAEWYNKFNPLFREILQESGRPSINLARDAEISASGQVTNALVIEHDDASPRTAETQRKSAGQWLLMVVAVICVGGLVWVTWALLRSNPKRKSFGSTMPSGVLFNPETSQNDADPSVGFMAAKVRPQKNTSAAPKLP